MNAPTDTGPRVVVPSCARVAAELSGASAWIAAHGDPGPIPVPAAAELVTRAGIESGASRPARRTLAAVAGAVPAVTAPPAGWSRVALAAVVAEAAHRATPPARDTTTGRPVPVVPALRALAIVAIVAAVVAAGWLGYLAWCWLCAHVAQVIAVLVGVAFIASRPGALASRGAR